MKRARGVTPRKPIIRSRTAVPSTCRTTISRSCPGALTRPQTTSCFAMRSPSASGSCARRCRSCACPQGRSPPSPGLSMPMCFSATCSTRVTRRGASVSARSSSLTRPARRQPAPARHRQVARPRILTAPRSSCSGGGLLTYRTDIAGSSERLDTSVLAARPFYFFQLGKGNYVRVAPIWVFDLENDTCHVPVGLGFGKVVPTEKVVFNFFVEPQFTILSKGAGQPEFQPFIAVNIQFKRSRACRAWLARRALCCRSSYRGRP
jgi:hypothetical protein